MIAILGCLKSIVLIVKAIWNSFGRAQRLLSKLVDNIFITTSLSWCRRCSDTWACSVRWTMVWIDVRIIAIFVSRVLPRLHNSTTCCVWSWKSRRWSILLRLIVMLLITYGHSTLVHFSLRIGGWFTSVTIWLVIRIDILAENAII